MPGAGFPLTQGVTPRRAPGITFHPKENTVSEDQPQRPMPQHTDFLEILPELQAGVVLEKLNAALSAVALGVCYSDAKKPEGEIILKMKLVPIGDSAQVAMSHTLSFTAPTPRGKKSETDTSETALHVGKRGRLSAYPERQEGFFDQRERANKE